MLIYNKKRYNIIELIKYLNSLEKKSLVTITYRGEDVVATYNVASGDIEELYILHNSPGTKIETKYNIMKICLDYKNICNIDFETSMLTWEEIGTLDLLVMMEDGDFNRIAFSVKEDFEGLYIIDDYSNFWETIRDLSDEYESNEVKFFRKVN